MNLNSPGAAGTVGFYSVGLSGVILDCERMPQNKVSRERKPGSALLTWKCRCPQITPGLVAIDLWIYLFHGLAVTTPDLVESPADIAKYPAGIAEGILFAERQNGLSGPVAEGIIREKLPRKRGGPRVVDAVGSHPKTCGFQRDHRPAAKRIQHRCAAGVGLL